MATRKSHRIDEEDDEGEREIPYCLDLSRCTAADLMLDVRTLT